MGFLDFVRHSNTGNNKIDKKILSANEISKKEINELKKMSMKSSDYNTLQRLQQQRVALQIEKNRKERIKSEQSQVNSLMYEKEHPRLSKLTKGAMKTGKDVFDYAKSIRMKTISSKGINASKVPQQSIGYNPFKNQSEESEGDRVRRAMGLR